jgi:hypothetical protein
MINRLEELILADRIEEAISYVSEMNAAHISSLLNYDTMDQAPEKFDLFIRGLYRAVESPYAKADVFHHLVGNYITALCQLDVADFVGRDLGLQTLRVLAERLAAEISLLEHFVGSPNKALPPATYQRLAQYAEQLQTMSFRSTASENEAHEKEIVPWLESIGENATTWIEMFRADQVQRSH